GRCHGGHPADEGDGGPLSTRLAQRGEGFLDVIQVLHSHLQPAKHNLSVGSDHGVSKDGLGAVQVPKFTEVPLGPGVHNKASDWKREHQRIKYSLSLPPPSC
uniref:Uncharacterized protein n=1 Tax=Paramormyrops kingsleyae TaxID=1676925 RepID=A0A3B3RBT5_9TELE